VGKPATIKYNKNKSKNKIIQTRMGKENGNGGRGRRGR
jgi:hypothetical protein